MSPPTPATTSHRTRALWMGVGVAAVALGLFLWLDQGREGGASTRRTVSFQGEVIAIVDERPDEAPRGIGLRLTRRTELLALGEVTSLRVDLDDSGLAIAARYERPGQRVVELERGGALVVDGQPVGKLEGPIVILDVLHRVRFTTPMAVTLFEPASAEAVPAFLVRRGPHIVVRDGPDGREIIARALPEGARLGPGAFAEGDAPPVRPWPPVEVAVPGMTSVKGLRLARGPELQATTAAPLAGDRGPGPFIESGATEVVDFARPLCRADALETARAVGEAVRARVDASVRGPAPGALAMLRHRGDCDGAAALAAAALRACGHAARVVVGYRLVEPGPSARLVPHALAEVYPSGPGEHAWWRLDPTVPVLTDDDDRFLAVAPGLGGALSMGRVLGVVDAGDVVVPARMQGVSPAPRQEPDAGP